MSFKLVWTIEGILKVFVVMIGKLEALIEAERAHVVRKTEDAQMLLAEAAAHTAEMQRATAIKTKIAALIA